ncbi:MAG: hypothetical protein KF708_23825 [Pirellulales bacterium]|nr:hypothetical protein [Pirellulales bacterium]
MGKQIDLSSELVDDAASIGSMTNRSIGDQIEYWAMLGRSIEPFIEGQSLRRLHEQGATILLSELLGSVDSDEGRQRVFEYLKSRPFPHFKQHPDSPDLLIRIDADGTETIGRFIGRHFEPAA